MVHFSLKYSQDFVNTFPENLVKLIRSSGVLPEQIGELQRIAEEMAKTVKQAIETYGTTHIWGLGDVYAYEVDGFGQYNLMDDANVPSLLAMSYLGYEPESQEVADNTRKLILSEANPFYYSGTKFSGIGSPHTPVRYVWHISKAIEGLTAPTKEEKHQMIHELMATDGGTGLMHEGVFFGVDEKRRLCSDHSLLFSIFFVFLFVYFLISYPQYCITSSQNIAFAQENHSLV